jgi:hypothetical protein
MFQTLIGSGRIIGVLLLSISSTSLALAQGVPLASLVNRSKAPSSGGLGTGAPDSENIVASFVAAETKVRDALNQHMFKRDAVLQTIGPNGEVTGEYIRNSQFVFDDRGRRIERVLFHPASTIREMKITKEDIQDLAGGQLLGVDIIEANKYVLTFGGEEPVDSRRLFAIDVTPRVQPDPNNMKERYFVGRVWVDPTTFQIVKIKGSIEPQGKQRFPAFETWREPVKGQLAFPARTEADDILHFQSRDVHYRIHVRYYDYRLFQSKVSITEVDDDLPKAGEAPGKVSVPPTKNAPPSVPEPKPKSNSPSRRAEAVRPSPNPIPTIQAPKVKSCVVNRDAPPVGSYHWPADGQVKVFFIRNMFTEEQRAAMVEAMGEWTNASSAIGSGVKFIDAGEADTRQTCRSCLTIRRRNVYKEDKHHYAFFNPMGMDEGRLLISAWIDLDFGITKPNALKGFLVHELGHGLGLWDCTTCKKKQTIMNGFTGINKDNGLVMPSACDLETVKDVYTQERQLAGLRLPGEKKPEANSIETALKLGPLGLEKSNFSALGAQSLRNNNPPAVAGKQTNEGPAGNTPIQPPPDLEEAGSSRSDSRGTRRNRSLFF